MTFKRPPARVKQYEGTKCGTPRAPVVSPFSGIVSAALAAKPIDVSTFDRKKAPIQRDATEVWADKVKASAKGEDCTVRLVGVCSFDPKKTVWSHGRWGAQLGEAGRGMGTKALDLCGAYACTDCDAAYDGQLKVPGLTRTQIDLDWCMGHFRSMGRLAAKGLL